MRLVPRRPRLARWFAPLSLLGCPSSPPQLTEVETDGESSSDGGSDAATGSAESGAEASSDPTSGGEESGTGQGDSETGTTGENRPPVVDSADTAVDGVRVLLTLDATDPDGTVAGFEIDWGDATNEMVSSTSASHDYGVPATYEISVVAIDDDDARSGPLTTTATSQVPSGALAYLPFDEASSGTSDLQGNEHTVSGVVEWDTDRLGLGGGALSLDRQNASDEGVLVTLAPLDLGNEVSMSLWVEMDNGCGVCGNTVRFAGIGNWFSLYTPGSGLRFGNLDGNSGEFPDQDAVADFTPPTGRPAWHHYVGVLERVTPGMYELRLYIDGELAATSSVSEAIPAAPQCRMYIGTFGRGDACTGTQNPEFSNFGGDIDDVRLYDRPLGDIEVQALYRERGY